MKPDELSAIIDRREGEKAAIAKVITSVLKGIYLILFHSRHTKGKSTPKCKNKGKNCEGQFEGANYGRIK